MACFLFFENKIDCHFSLSEGISKSLCGMRQHQNLASEALVECDLDSLFFFAHRYIPRKKICKRLLLPPHIRQKKRPPTYHHLKETVSPRASTIVRDLEFHSSAAYYTVFAAVHIWEAKILLFKSFQENWSLCWREVKTVRTARWYFWFRFWSGQSSHIISFERD